MDVISLTRKLLSFNTINPPGNEEDIARFVGELLKSNGFQTDYYAFGEGRLHLVAARGIPAGGRPVIFSGHFDTVPLGNTKWNSDPFAGNVTEGKIWGRGSSDMKGGLAAMIAASVTAFQDSPPPDGIKLIFTAGEELGCQGAEHLIKEIREPGKAGGLIVGEPTANIPVIGHKGAIYLNAVISGLTAHSSMPELGDNAIYKAAGAILKARDFDFMTALDPLLGYPTINVGKVSGGMNINSVPDHAEFSIDIRTTSQCNHGQLISRLALGLGPDTKLETLVDKMPVFTDEKDPFVRHIYDICGVDPGDKSYPRTLPYLTDGSVLQRFYNGIPTIIMGPGEPGMAHQTDEYCYIKKIEESVKIYRETITKWRN
jgi:succinyl-diaminopimelate desuccinylase